MDGAIRTTSDRQPGGEGQRMDRRRFLSRATGLGLSGAALALIAGCERLSPPAAPRAAEAPPETTTLRLARSPAICYGPQYVAEDLLRGEGFADVRYVEMAPADIPRALAAGDIHLNMLTAGIPIVELDADARLTVLAGIHVGCFELFGTNAVRSLSDLKGKRVAVTAQSTGRHLHLASMAAYVGIDPNRDITWITDAPAEAIRLLAEGQIDAFMAFPPEPQELRARGIGHVIVNTHTDRPWSQYFCCMLTANQQFVQKQPIATKRALRAIMKATDVCAREPQRAAREIVNRGYTNDYGYALQTFQEVPYDRWREYDPEDTIRFYALRLQEAGMIKSSPNTIIQRGTDWRFLNELKQELKV